MSSKWNEQNYSNGTWRTGQERREEDGERDVGRIWDSGVVTLAASCAAAVCVQLLGSFTRPPLVGYS